MAYTWEPLSPDRVLQYHLSYQPSDEFVAKRFTNEFDFVRELYYARIVNGQSWTTHVFTEPVSYHYDPSANEYLVFYPRLDEYDASRIEELTPRWRVELVNAVYWLARFGFYFVSVSREALRLSGRHLTLVDYQLSTNPTNDLTPRVLERLGEVIGNDVSEYVGEAMVQEPVFRPVLVGTLEEFRQRLRDDLQWRFNEPVLLGRGYNGCVYSPPTGCPDLPMKGRYVGKVVKRNRVNPRRIRVAPEDIERELESVELLATVDPRAEFHTKFIRTCQVDPPDDCDYVGGRPNGTITELVYAHGGVAVEKVLGTIANDPIHRLWFYVGLEQFLGHLVEFYQRGAIHFDLHASNVVVDEYYTFRMIDFGNIVRADVEDMSAGNRGMFYPVETWVDDVHSHDLRAMVVEMWDDYLEEFHCDDGVLSAFEVVMDLHGMELGRFHRLLERYFSQLLKMQPVDRWNWTKRHLNAYTFAITFATAVHRESKGLYDELHPILYHLVAYDLHDRSIEFARARLRRLISDLEDRVGERGT